MKHLNEFLIIREFTHSTTNYILFTLEHTLENQKSDYEYLYINNNAKSMVSILYGIDFDKRITEILKDPAITCIECNMSLNINGGISYDSGDIVEFGLTKKDANNIIRLLSTHSNLTQITDFIF